jgi:hypothetical protein
MVAVAGPGTSHDLAADATVRAYSLTLARRLTMLRRGDQR